MNNSNQHRWGIVLAGGEGRRLREFLKTEYRTDSPKQFCALLGDRSMLRRTIDRAQLVIPDERIITIITKHHVSYANKDLYTRPRNTVVIQPEGRETGPAILLPLLHILRCDPQAQVAIFPSDHFVEPEERFMEYVDSAFSFSAALTGYINLLGIPAHGIQDGYGWIEPGEVLGSRYGTELFKVKRFIEKPAVTAASRIYYENYLCNTFTMIGHISIFLTLARFMMPEVYYPMKRITNALGTSQENRVTEEVYNGIPPINFSKAVLEQSVEYLSVIPVRDVYWNDWGEESRVRSDLTMLGYSFDEKPSVAMMSP